VAALDAANARADTAEGALAAAKAEIAKLESAKPDLDAIRDEAIKGARARVDLEAEVVTVARALDAKDCAGKSDVELRKAALAKLAPDFAVGGVSDDAVGGAYAFAMSRAKAAAAADRSLRGALDAPDPIEPALTPAQIDLRSAVAGGKKDGK